MRRKERVAAAKALIAHLANNEVTAVICGGYARDAICDKPIRDVDLYVSEHDWMKASGLLRGDCIDPRERAVPQDSPEYMHQSIRDQLEFSIEEGSFGLPTNTVNLIGIKHMEVTVDNVIERYNFGLCKAGIGPHGLVSYDDFYNDYKDKQITLFRLDWGYEASFKQWLKLQDKYPWPMRMATQPTFLSTEEQL